jgi:hypothetical protein
MELHELHVLEIGTGMVGERVAVAGVFPAVAGDGVGAADAARRQYDRLGVEDPEPAAFAVLGEGSGDPFSIL